MGYAEILVQVGADASAPRRLEIAKDLAAQFEARLVGVFLEPSPPSPFAAGFEAPLPQAEADRLLARHGAETEARGERAHAAFKDATAGLRMGWRTLEGGGPGPLTLAARAADLLIMPGPPENMSGGVFAPADSIALASGCPLLIVPPTGSTAQVGRRVVVAWNGSREAARALRDALPLLRAAESVTGVIVGHPADAREGEAVLEGVFERHGCNATIVRLPHTERTPGEVLLRQAARIDADLVVMGLYGHSRFREFILGGASREMMEHSPLPLFLAH